MTLDPAAPAASHSMPVASSPSTPSESTRAERLPYLLAWDHVAVMRIPVAMLRCEPGLFDSKWFDYRFTHPSRATEVFADEYAKAYQVFWRKYRDVTEAPLKQGFRGDSLFASSPHTVTSTWAARQAADVLGMPYGFFISRALEIVLRRWKNPRLPRPNQLLRPELVPELIEQWDEWCGSQLMRAEHKRYLNCNFRGEPAQLAHHEWLVAQIWARHGHPRVIGHVCFELQQLPEARARAEFGDERVDRARAEVSGSAPLEPLSETAFRVQMPIGCFGVPHAPQSTDKACSTCRHFAACATASDGMLASIKMSRGTTDPVGARKKAQDRARQRRCRARKRAEKAAALARGTPGAGS